MVRHWRSPDQTPSFADGRTKTQAEATCSQLSIEIKVELEQGLRSLAILPGISYLAIIVSKYLCVPDVLKFY